MDRDWKGALKNFMLVVNQFVYCTECLLSKCALHIHPAISVVWIPDITKMLVPPLRTAFNCKTPVPCGPETGNVQDTDCRLWATASDALYHGPFKIGSPKASLICWLLTIFSKALLQDFRRNQEKINLIRTPQFLFHHELSWNIMESQNISPKNGTKRLKDKHYKKLNFLFFLGTFSLIRKNIEFRKRCITARTILRTL